MSAGTWQGTHVHACSLTYPACATSHFSTLSHKRRDFREEVTDHKMCVLVFSTTFGEKTLSHSKKNLARYCHKCDDPLL